MLGSTSMASFKSPTSNGLVPPPPEPTADESPEGVDRTLVRWMLSLTPDQRLDALQAFADSVWALRNARRT